MISATSLNAPNTLNKGHSVPLGLENGHLRMDSQKFLVPSLPVSARGIGGQTAVMDPKRRERSIVNGTGQPLPPPNGDFQHVHNHSFSHSYPNPMNGLRPSTFNHSMGGPTMGRESSPNSRTSSSPHHHPLYLSPRKDTHSPMYPGDVPAVSPGGGGGHNRSSMPIPCSSPAQASSASPKGHSPSGGVAAGAYSPKLPSGPTMLAAPTELGSLGAGRLYPPSFPAPHPSVAAQFYAQMCQMPYPIMFGNPYNPHSHSSANAYLETFRSTLVRRGTNNNDVQQRSRSRSPSPSPTNRNISAGAYHAAQQHQSPHSHYPPGPSAASVTSLHNKLIDSSSIATDRHSYAGHHHNHNHQQISSGPFSPQHFPMIGISKGGPLGISGGIMNLQSARGHGSSQSKHGPQPENLVVHKSHQTNGYHHKHWVEQHGMNNKEGVNREMEANESNKSNSRDVGQFRHHGMSPSPPRDMRISYSPNNGKPIPLTTDAYPPNHGNNGISNRNVHHHLQMNAGILTDSNQAKKHQQINGNNILSQQIEYPPRSPKKRSAVNHWNFAVPLNPTTKVELPPPPPPPSLNHLEQSKYLNSNQIMSQSRPSNNSQLSSPLNSSNTYLASRQSAQHSYPPSPKSGPSTPKSPAVHQVKFTFSSGSTKENLRGNKHGSKNGRNDSSSSSSSNEGNVAWPVENMPLMEAFRKGSLIRLANGSLRPVEDLKVEDFIQAVASMSGTLRIIHCTVLSIQKLEGNHGNPSCKVTMAIGSHVQNQQVVVPSSLEQPFFVVGRGWCSLSPATTEKLLQLPCSPLAVGDVCITLSKNTTSAKTQGQPPRSPSTRGKKPGPGRGMSHASSQLKRTFPVPVEPQKRTDDSKISAASLPTSTISAIPSIPNTATVETKPEIVKTVEENALGPPSPKRRRWSAPEPDSEISSKAVKANENMELQESKIERKNSSSSSPSLQRTPPVPPSKDERAESDRKVSTRGFSDGVETDVNSNLNVVKGNVKEDDSVKGLHSSESTDAQNTKV